MRDIYTYAHIPIVAGIVLIAVALEIGDPPSDRPALRHVPGDRRRPDSCCSSAALSIGVYRAFRVVAVERLAILAAIVA